MTITFTCKAMFAIIYYVVHWLQTTSPIAAYKFACLQVDINPCSNQYIKVVVKWVTHTMNSFINIAETKPFNILNSRYLLTNKGSS